MVAPAKSLTPARSLRILGNPIAGLVRAAVTAGRETAEYVFSRRQHTVSVRKADGTEYTVDPVAGTCSCAARRFRRVERCRHLCACDVLAARGHL
jgi:hypothetical protein